MKHTMHYCPKLLPYLKWRWENGWENQNQEKCMVIATRLRGLSCCNGRQGFSFPSMSLTVLHHATHSLLSLCVVRIPLPVFRPPSDPPLPTMSLFLSTHSSLLVSLSLSLFLPLFMCLLKLSDLLLTPSSSTQPAHSVLWDELWLILSLHPSPPSLVTYLPFCSSLQVSLSLPCSHKLTDVWVAATWARAGRGKKLDWRIKHKTKVGDGKHDDVQAHDRLPSA